MLAPVKVLRLPDPAVVASERLGEEAAGGADGRRGRDPASARSPRRGCWPLHHRSDTTAYPAERRAPMRRSAGRRAATASEPSPSSRRASAAGRARRPVGHRASRAPVHPPGTRSSAWFAAPSIGGGRDWHPEDSIDHALDMVGYTTRGGVRRRTCARGARVPYNTTRVGTAPRITRTMKLEKSNMPVAGMIRAPGRARMGSVGNHDLRSACGVHPAHKKPSQHGEPQDDHDHPEERLEERLHGRSLPSPPPQEASTT